MYSCHDCGYLDKSRKNAGQNPQNFQYGCNYRGVDKFICGWCKSDKDLKLSFLGCSNWIPIIQEDKFLKGLAKKCEVLVTGERNGNHITYQYSKERFLNEFENNTFRQLNNDGDIVTNFYLDGERVTNFKVFPGTFETDSETIYDVVAYILKKQYVSGLKGKERPIVVDDKNQLEGQMTITDWITF